MDNQEIKTKRCSKCGRILPITEFHKDKSRKDGLQCWCKDCQKAMKKEWYQSNKDAILKKQAAYNQANKCKIAEYNAAYYQANKGKIAECKAAYIDPQTHPMNWARNMVNAYRQIDRDRFGDDSQTITAEWFLDNIAYKPCAHCGVQRIGLVGCNRLDNTKGHTIDNVEPCCFKCNAKENILDQIRRGVHISCKWKARHKTA